MLYIYFIFTFDSHCSNFPTKSYNASSISITKFRQINKNCSVQLHRHIVFNYEFKNSNLLDKMHNITFYYYLK